MTATRFERPLISVPRNKKRVAATIKDQAHCFESRFGRRNAIWQNRLMLATTIPRNAMSPLITTRPNAVYTAVSFRALLIATRCQMARADGLRNHRHIICMSAPEVRLIRYFDLGAYYPPRNEGNAGHKTQIDTFPGANHDLCRHRWRGVRTITQYTYGGRESGLHNRPMHINFLPVLFS